MCLDDVVEPGGGDGVRVVGGVGDAGGDAAGVVEAGVCGGGDLLGGGDLVHGWARFQ